MGHARKPGDGPPTIVSSPTPVYTNPVCGRYTQTAKLDHLVGRFGINEPDFDLAPRYNLAPNQPAPVVGVRPDTPELRSLRLMRWGLVPYWAKDPRIGNKMINARAETLGQRPAFKHLLSSNRCLVLADGFYEWFKDGRTKTPMRFVLQSEAPFAFAGLWDRWRQADDKILYSFTIITTEPNALVGQIHNRMPAILRPEDEGHWLDPTVTNAGAITRLLKPYPAEWMKSYCVSRIVNSPANDIPDCITPEARGD